MKYLVMPSHNGEVEGEVQEWYIREGQQVQKNIPIVNVVVGHTGISLKGDPGLSLRRLVVPEYSIVPVGTILALIGTRDESLPTPDQVADDQARLQEMSREHARDEQQRRNRSAPPAFYRTTALIMGIFFLIYLVLLVVALLQHHSDRIFPALFFVLLSGIMLTSSAIRWRQRVKEQA